MQYFIYVPVVSGAVMLLFAKPLAAECDRRSKAFWRTVTFGKTDMARFFSDGHRGVIAIRIVGVGFVLFGVFFIYMLGFPFRGPGEFKAANEARDYLSAVYGSSDGEESFSATREVPDRTVVIVDYKFGAHSGSLRATWHGEKYEFSEVQKK